ncbi:MAG: SDR family NAD(P)-dependent oxidoreductase [Proteobacteria bacterium]|nr:SDR family NAD(P)-dependent oxidoreductase [Pseudomonadota bacterium]
MKNILIIGGARGIGRALAKQLSAQATHLFITSREFEKTRQSEQGVYQLGCDITQTDSIHRLFNAIEQQVDSLDLLINCAGILHNDDYQPEKSLQQVDKDNLLHNYHVNALGHLIVLKYAENILSQSKQGLVASISARIGSLEDNYLGGWYAYRMSKAALNMGLKTLSIEWARKHPHIKFLLLHPGTTDTELSRPFQKRLPKGQLQTTEETASMLLEQIEKNKDHKNKHAVFIDYAGKTIPW